MYQYDALNINIYMSNKYDYKILTKEEILEWEKSGRKRPCCTSCTCDYDTIVGWKAINKETGNEIYTCPLCLDCYTSISSHIDATKLDFTKKSDLKKIVVIECKTCKREVATANKHEVYCTTACDPDHDHNKI